MATIHSLKPSAQPKRKVLVVEDNLDSVHQIFAKPMDPAALEKLLAGQ
jgi:hypothetical protein